MASARSRASLPGMAARPLQTARARDASASGQSVRRLDRTPGCVQAVHARRCHFAQVRGLGIALKVRVSWSALFELKMDGDRLMVIEERHYKLVPAGELDRKAIVDYRT